MSNYYEQGRFSVRAHLRDHECLDLAGMGDMGADTKVYHRPAAVYGGGGSVGNLGLDDIFLVLVVLCPSSHELVSFQYMRVYRRRTPNISSRVSLGTTRRSNFCFSLMARSATFSSAG